MNGMERKGAPVVLLLPKSEPIPKGVSSTASLSLVIQTNHDRNPPVDLISLRSPLRQRLRWLNRYSSTQVWAVGKVESCPAFSQRLTGGTKTQARDEGAEVES